MDLRRLLDRQRGERLGEDVGAFARKLGLELGLGLGLSIEFVSVSSEIVACRDGRLFESFVLSLIPRD